jgi:hypothetical protein
MVICSRTPGNRADAAFRIAHVAGIGQFTECLTLSLPISLVTQNCVGAVTTRLHRREKW